MTLATDLSQLGCQKVYSCAPGITHEELIDDVNIISNFPFIWRQIFFKYLYCLNLSLSLSHIRSIWLHPSLTHTYIHSLFLSHTLSLLQILTFTPPLSLFLPLSLLLFFFPFHTHRQIYTLTLFLFLSFWLSTLTFLSLSLFLSYLLPVPFPLVMLLVRIYKKHLSFKLFFS